MSPTTKALTDTPSPGLVVCCALAEYGNPLSGLHMDRDYANRLVKQAVSEQGPDALLRWRQRVQPDQWEICWRWARTAAQWWSDIFPDVQHLPGSYTEAELPGAV